MRGIASKAMFAHRFRHTRNRRAEGVPSLITPHQSVCAEERDGHQGCPRGMRDVGAVPAKAQECHLEHLILHRKRCVIHPRPGQKGGPLPAWISPSGIRIAPKIHLQLLCERGFDPASLSIESATPVKVALTRARRHDQARRGPFQDRNSVETAMPRQAADTQGDSRSPTRAAFQNMPIALRGAKQCHQSGDCVRSSKLGKTGFRRVLASQQEKGVHRQHTPASKQASKACTFLSTSTAVRSPLHLCGLMLGITLCWGKTARDWLLTLSCSCRGWKGVAHGDRHMCR